MKYVYIVKRGDVIEVFSSLLKAYKSCIPCFLQYDALFDNIKLIDEIVMDERKNITLYKRKIL